MFFADSTHHEDEFPLPPYDVPVLFGLQDRLLFFRFGAEQSFDTDLLLYDG